MVPTLVRTLGVKGHRPEVGTRDNKDKVYAFASVNCVTGKLTTRLHKSTVKGRRTKKSSHTQCMQAAFARHIRDVGRVYPAAFFPRVVLTIDNAAWHRGRRVERALAKVPHVELYRLPSYSPQLNAVERLWKLLRQRATHNQLFDDVGALSAALRKQLDWLQVHRSHVRSLIGAEG